MKKREDRGSVDIHNYQKRVHDALENIASSQLPSEDKVAILQFSDTLRAQGLSLGRIAKYVYHLKTLSENLVLISGCGGLEQADMQAISKLSGWLNGSSRYRPQTRKDFFVVLKRFYQWKRVPPQEYPRWRRRHLYPPEVEDLSTTLKFNETVLPSDLLTADEVNRLLSVANHPMLFAYIALSDEVGPRAGEILGMTIRSLTFDGTDVICRLGGKTGERIIYLVKSVSAISHWLSIHPLRDDPHAPLWLNLSNNNRHARWTYGGCKRILEELAKKAQIKKRLYPHLFRHSAATRDAKLGFTETQLCLKYGWVPGSRTPRIYIHLAGTDLKQKIMETYGGRQIERPKPQTIKCPRCSAVNHPGQNYCYTCGSPLEPAPKTVELEEMRKELREIKDALKSLLLSQRPGA